MKNCLKILSELSPYYLLFLHRETVHRPRGQSVVMVLDDLFFRGPNMIKRPHYFDPKNALFLGGCRPLFSNNKKVRKKMGKCGPKTLYCKAVILELIEILPHPLFFRIFILNNYYFFISTDSTAE